MNFLQQYDIVKLANEKNYTVAELLEEKNKTFLMLVEMNKKEEMTENFIYAKVAVLPSRKYGIETIEDIKEKQRLADIFLPMFEKDYK